MALPKKIVFCLPGKSYSSNWFNSWNASITKLNKLGIEYAYSNAYDPVVYFTRNKILGGSNTKGPSQKPWQGTLPYDKMVWIDSDIVWSPQNLIQLLQHDMPITSGTYRMHDMRHYPVVENLNFSHLAEHGIFEFMSETSMQNRTQPFKASYTGFGFLAIQHGVIEKMMYPWFQPRWVTNEKFYDFCAEDVGFCWSAQEQGFEIWVDPTIKVGHEKSLVI